MTRTGLVAAQYDAADNMTDRLGALSVAIHGAGIGDALRGRLLTDFRARFDHEPLVLDKWFALQATAAEAGTLGRVEALMQDPAFSINNPNRVRALIGAFAMSNPTQFNRADGAGYTFVTQQVVDLDARNPQLAARLLTAFNTGAFWRRAGVTRRAPPWRASQHATASHAMSQISCIARSGDLRVFPGCGAAEQSCCSAHLANHARKPESGIMQNCAIFRCARKIT